MAKSLRSRALDTEPARTVAGAGALVALLALAVVFGLPLSHTQQNAIVTFLAVGGPVAVAKYVRPLVWSRASHRRAVAAARPKET